jgi:hypothetical protein
MRFVFKGLNGVLLYTAVVPKLHHTIFQNFMGTQNNRLRKVVTGNTVSDKYEVISVSHHVSCLRNRTLRYFVWPVVLENFPQRLRAA